MWPDNKHAIGQLRRAQVLLAGFELDQRNPIGADTALREIAALDGAAPESAEVTALRARLLTLRSAARDERQALASLAVLRHESDETVSARLRALLFSGTNLTLAAAVAALGWTGHEPTNGIFMALAGGWLVMFSVILAWGHKRLLVNQVNRNVIASTFVYFCVLFVQTVIAVQAEAPVAYVMVDSLVLFAFWAAMLMLLVSRNAWVFLGGVVPPALWLWVNPGKIAFCLSIFLASNAVVAVVYLSMLVRQRRRALGS